MKGLSMNNLPWFSSENAGRLKSTVERSRGEGNRIGIKTSGCAGNFDSACLNSKQNTSKHSKYFPIAAPWLPAINQLSTNTIYTVALSYILRQACHPSAHAHVVTFENVGVNDSIDQSAL